MAQWSTLMPCNREAAGSNLWGFGFYLKGAHYEVDYSGKNLLSWTAMHIDFVMCKKGDPFGFFDIHCVAKYRNKRSGDPLVKSKKVRKKVA